MITQNLMHHFSAATALLLLSYPIQYLRRASVSLAPGLRLSPGALCKQDACATGPVTLALSSVLIPQLFQKRLGFGMV
jgi:hypothetical protein